MRVWSRRVLAENYEKEWMKGIFFPQTTDTSNTFVHVINQPLNMSPHSAPLMGNLVIIGNNKPLRTLRALRTVFTRKSNGLTGN